MKKVVVISLLLVLTFSFNTMAQDSYFNTKLGISFNGNSTWDIDESIFGGADLSFDFDPGAVLAVEYFKPVTQHVDLGLGVAYQFKRDVDFTSDTDLEFKSIPAYLALKYNSGKIYLVSQLGYSSLDLDYDGDSDDNIDTDGGLYYGLGAGYKFAENKFWELLYSVSNGEIKDKSGDIEKYDIENSQLTLSFGMSF
jgi:hypothetical protein